MASSRFASRRGAHDSAREFLRRQRETGQQNRRLPLAPWPEIKPASAQTGSTFTTYGRYGMSRRSRASRLGSALTAACGSVLLGGAPMASAQDAAQVLEGVTVTGSNIKRTEAETASPVQVITRQDIERTGKQSIQEVLRSVTADGQGSIPSSFSNGFAAGSAAVSLRGLGVNSTLVLVNGRRMTTYGLADDGTRNFVDLNSIPLEVGRAGRGPEGRRLRDLRLRRHRRRGQHHPAQELHRRLDRRPVRHVAARRRRDETRASARSASATSTPTSTTSS